MTLENTQLKLAESERTGDLIGFVSRHSKTQKLMGVREDSRFGKKICVLSKELRGTLKANRLYDVELKHMRKGYGYVIISAEPILFPARVEMFIVPGKSYHVRATFGNKIVYFDPMDGRSSTSKTLDGVVALLWERDDIENKELVIQKFITRSKQLILRMRIDGFPYDETQK